MSSAGDAVPVDEVERVRAANRAFYDAFESRDMDAMSELWERSPRALCTHAGWGTLRGWAQVAASFFALFQGPRTQFLLTEERVEVEGSLAWVTVDENLLGDGGGATVATLNLFAYDELADAWRLVGHHGSPVSASVGS
ncbi:MAG: nuclear transport factor 2 family protein [Acidimicrobiales bacterium]